MCGDIVAELQHSDNDGQHLPGLRPQGNQSSFLTPLTCRRGERAPSSAPELCVILTSVLLLTSSLICKTFSEVTASWDFTTKATLAVANQS